MKIKISILSLTFLFYTIKLNAQYQIHVDPISVNYFNGITEKKEIIDKYHIINNSAEDYLTWVSLVPINKRTRKGDFNLIEMMCENLLENQPINIGYSFVKNITAGTTFSYFIVKNETESNFYRERIVIIKKKEVEQYLKMTIDKKYFYQLSDIFLIEK